ncbi:YfhJ family protein [Jeotgalibacillus proteolyticus]|uniref:YfhJ family protein n=1 Tax=Jeotgalibacillus proteolyticus TaxID=2082395 RepID=UPI003CE828C5
MNEEKQSLTALLLEKNQELSAAKAQTLVDLLWEDFEATYAKAGHDYQGKEVTTRVVRQWIVNYGERLHQVAAMNPKYAELLSSQEDTKH